MRSADRNYTQTVQAIRTLERIVLGAAPATSHIKRRHEARCTSQVNPLAKFIGSSELVVAGGWRFTVTYYDRTPLSPPGALLIAADITIEHLRAAVRTWEADGLATSTIITRLACLNVLGVHTAGCYPKASRLSHNKPKWWLRPEQQAKALAWLAERPVAKYHQLANLLLFNTHTGLRVEEALRLTWADVMLRGARTVIAVPGTKTANAVRSVPISAEAIAVLDRMRGLDAAKVFPLPYHQMAIVWRECREHIGLEDPRVATLKAFRRNAARHLTVNGMPTAVLKDYLGHSKIETTLGYLKLAGGYNEEEFGKWL